MKTFKITGVKYSTEPTFYSWDNEQKYPHFEEIESKVFTEGTSFESLDHASLWLMNTHPEYWCGCHITECSPAPGKPGDFLCNADLSYYVSIYHTTDIDTIVNNEKQVLETLLSHKSEPAVEYKNDFSTPNKDLTSPKDIDSDLTMLVNPKYKSLVMAALYEANNHELLGNIGNKDAAELYNRLKYEDYCNERGIKYEDLTEDDFEVLALKELEENEYDEADFEQ